MGCRNVGLVNSQESLGGCGLFFLDKQQFPPSGKRGAFIASSMLVCGMSRTTRILDGQEDRSCTELFRGSELSLPKPVDTTRTS